MQRRGGADVAQSRREAQREARVRSLVGRVACCGAVRSLVFPNGWTPFCQQSPALLTAQAASAAPDAARSPVPSAVVLGGLFLSALVLLALRGALRAVHGSGANAVVSAPTASGKTALMELAVCRLLAAGAPGGSGRRRVVYVAPAKALCQQLCADWSARFARVGLACAELTGDADDARALADADFCSSRKGAEAAAQQVAKDCDARALVAGAEQARELARAAERAKDRALAECLRRGVAFHSAGMARADRALVEDLFSRNAVLALATTSTLAQGVNFPARLVVVKSTQCYRPGAGYQELEEIDVLQMIGRAGRPQFDTQGVAVIMTAAEHKAKWERIALHDQPIESSLLGSLKEHLVAEVCLGSVRSVGDAMAWLRSTFLYRRLLRNPAHYGVPAGLSDDKLAERLQEICLGALREVDAAGLAALEQSSGAIRATPKGRNMSRFYVAFETMRLFDAVPPDAGMEALLMTLSRAREFADIHLRVSEKKHLNRACKERAVRYPLRGRAATDADKVFLLIQMVLGDCEADDWGLKQEAQHVFRCVCRLARCLAETLVLLRPSYAALCSALALSACLRNRVWEQPASAGLRQIDQIGKVHARQLAESGVDGLLKLAAADPRRVEAVCGRRPPFGDQVRAALSALLLPELLVSFAPGDGALVVDLRLSPLVRSAEAAGGGCCAAEFTVVVGVGSAVALCQRVCGGAGTTRVGTVRADVHCGRAVRVAALCETTVGLDHVLVLAPPSQPQTQQQQSGSASPVVSRGCHHACRNKLACGHACCKSVLHYVPRPPADFVSQVRQAAARRSAPEAAGPSASASASASAEPPVSLSPPCSPPPTKAARTGEAPASAQSPAAAPVDAAETLAGEYDNVFASVFG
eukprot:m51a1_g5369 hypothetical protein (874) ;mRNA; r:523445-527878